MEQGVLVVVGGRPGTGKTTLSRLLVGELSAAYVRIDAIVGPLLRSRLIADKAEAAGVGYELAREVAAENLALGVGVVVDGLSATHERRAVWREVAQEAGVPLVFLETMLGDAEEHRRRVDERSSGSTGYLGPSWATIQGSVYEPWDEQRSGPRLTVDTSDIHAGFIAALTYIRRARRS